MTTYTIRLGDFSITKDGNIYAGGDEVDLTIEEFYLHKHKLEGVESTVEPIDFGIGNNNGSNNGDNNVVVVDSFPAPHFSSVSPNKIVAGLTGKLKIFGSYFTEDIQVGGTGFTVDNITFISDNELQIDVTAGETLGSFAFQLDNGKAIQVNDAIEIFEPLVWDFRGDGFDQAFSKSTQASITSNPYWLTVTTGGSGWQGAVKFLGDDDQYVWSRETKKTISWIFFPDSNGMLGIGSVRSSFAGNQLYYQGEALGYFNSGSLNSLYGNNGTRGNGTIQFLQQQSYGNADIVKFTLTNNGEPGGIWQIWNLTPDDAGWQDSGLTRDEFLSQSLSVADWLSEDRLIASGTIDDQMAADENDLLPYVCLRSNITMKLIGFTING